MRYSRETKRYHKDGKAKGAPRKMQFIFSSDSQGIKKRPSILHRGAPAHPSPGAALSSGISHPINHPFQPVALGRGVFRPNVPRNITGQPRLSDRISRPVELPPLAEGTRYLENPQFHHNSHWHFQQQTHPTNISPPPLVYASIPLPQATAETVHHPYSKAVTNMEALHYPQPPYFGLNGTSRVHRGRFFSVSSSATTPEPYPRSDFELSGSPQPAPLDCSSSNPADHSRFAASFISQ